MISSLSTFQLLISDFLYWSSSQAKHVLILSFSKSSFHMESILLFNSRHYIRINKDKIWRLFQGKWRPASNFISVCLMQLKISPIMYWVGQIFLSTTTNRLEEKLFANTHSTLNSVTKAQAHYARILVAKMSHFCQCCSSRTT